MSLKTAQRTSDPTDRYSALELRHLRLVRAVGEEHGLTAAGKRLSLTASALSHQLRQVESIVGLPLFRREHRRMRLTAAGEIVFELAHRTLAAIDDVEDRLASLRTGSGGTIRLCAHCYTGYHWLPAVMQSFRTSHPDAEVRVVAEATYRSLDALMDHEVDLVITASDVTDTRLHKSPVLHDEIFLVVAPGHPLARRASVEPVHIANEHIILYAPTPEESGICVQFLKPAGVWPRRYTSVLLTEGIIEMVKAGLGVTFLAEWSVRPELERGTLVAVRLGRRGFKRTWQAITTRDSRDNPILRTFIEHLAATLQAGRSKQQPRLATS